MDKKVVERTNTLGSSQRARQFFMQYAIYLVLFCVILVIVFMEPTFLSVRNITFILQQAATKLIIALGVAGLLPPATSAMLHNASTLAISLRSMTPLAPAGSLAKAP